MRTPKCSKGIEFEYWPGYVLKSEGNGIWCNVVIPGDDLDLPFFIGLEEFALEDRPRVKPGTCLRVKYSCREEDVVGYELAQEVPSQEEIDAAKARAKYLFDLL